MPVYKTNADDLQKIKDLQQYSFLYDNAKHDHDTHWTITLSPRSRDMLQQKLGIELAFVDAIHHVPPPKDDPQ